MQTPRNDAEVRLTTILQTLTPIADRLLRAAEWMKSNPHTRMPEEMTGTYAELAEADQACHDFFCSHSSYYPELLSRWTPVTLAALKITLISGIAEIFAQRVMLTQIALAAVRQRSKIVAASSVFLSHTSADKPFVRKLAGRLREHGVRTWLDEAELNAGQSLLDSIGAALDEMRFLVAVLSNRSIDSRWVREELKVALSREFTQNAVVVIPVIIENVHDRIPPFLRDKIWIDFLDPARFDIDVARLLRSIGAAEPLSEVIGGLGTESAAADRRRCAPRDVKYGRQLLRELASDPACDIPANRRWLFWDLTRRIFKGRYPGTIKVGWLETSGDEKRFAVRVEDELLNATVAIDLTDDQCANGVW